MRVHVAEAEVVDTVRAAVVVDLIETLLTMNNWTVEEVMKGVVVAMVDQVVKEEMVNVLVEHLNDVVAPDVDKHSSVYIYVRNEFKHEGAGRGNWGSHSEEFNPVTEEVKHEGEKHLDAEKPTNEDFGINKENPTNEPEEKEPEDKEMTLEEYEKILEEKRKSLMALKTEERKVKIDEELASMQPLSNKKSDEEIFVKLGSNKDKRKENSEKEEKAKKLLSINEFLKPVEGEKYFSPSGRGRGRGGCSSRGFSGPISTQNYMNTPTSIAIEDPGQFPTLGAM